MTQPQNKAEKCEHKNKRRWMMDLESGIRCDDCGADLSLKFSVSQPQLSVRERAREMVDTAEIFDTFCRTVDLHGDAMGKEYFNSAMDLVIDQIITLVQEEKTKETVGMMEKQKLRTSDVMVKEAINDIIKHVIEKK